MGEPLNPKEGADAEPQVRGILAHMFHCVNATRNGDVWGDMMRKDEKLSKYLSRYSRTNSSVGGTASF
jgi:hypothetical protein